MLGLPLPNGLVPQAPVHTDSLTIYETELRVTPTGKASDGTRPGEMRTPIVRAKAVVEQRMTHFLMGLLLIGTMTGPLLAVLHTMPAAVFAGVFFVVGVSSPGSLFFSSRSLSLSCPAGSRPPQEIPRTNSMSSLNRSGDQSSPTASSRNSSTSTPKNASSSGTTLSFASPGARSPYSSFSKCPAS